MKTLENFLLKHPPNRRISKLKKYEKEIRKLYDENYKVEQIQEFLNLKDIEVTIDAIYRFLRKKSTEVSTFKKDEENTPSPKSKAMEKFLQKTGEIK